MTRARNRCPVASQEPNDFAAAQAKVANLETALESARTIGMAIGILMERLKIAPPDAFDVLVRASQHEHRRLRDIASDLVFSGELGHVPPHEHGYHRTAGIGQHAAAPKVERPVGEPSRNSYGSGGDPRLLGRDEQPGTNRNGSA
jgi:ANTAR domain